jgi:hypothetical protein
MTPIQQCLQSLAVLAKTDDLNGISLAESKIDEFLRTAGTESAWQIVALDDLKLEITERGWGTPCGTASIALAPRERPASTHSPRTGQTRKQQIGSSSR